MLATTMFQIAPRAFIYDHELEFSAIRAQGAGGQNVNKVSSAIHLRFDIRASSLPDDVKARLLTINDSRLTSDGVVVIKAQEHRTQEKNRVAAVERLREMLSTALIVKKKRRPTKPTLGSKKRRLAGKKQRGEVKKMRGRVDY